MYNSEKYLRDCLNSLAAQTLQSVEFICVDDGSTDETPNIVREYTAKDKRFSLIQKPNAGFGQTMNIGIEASRGEYITSLDSDDLLVDNALETMLHFAKENDLDFLKADRLYFSGNPAEASMQYNKMGHTAEQYASVFNSSDNPRKWMLKSGLPGMYRRAFLNNNGIRLNETPGASFQDTGLTAQAVFHAKRARLLDEPVYLVRRDNEQSSTHDSSKVFCICDEHDFIRAKASECAYNRLGCLRAAAWLRFDGYEWNYSRLFPEDRPGFVNRAHSDFLALESSKELDRNSFDPEQWKLVRLLIDNPMEYYARKEYGKQIDSSDARATQYEAIIKKREQRIADLEGSLSYRIGRAVTFAPRKAKAAIRAIRSNIAGK